ncbi:MAG TPA: hypothetical protein VLT88_13110, partial [Desulfosarcina sp.]|nr:hypothetical protein [Desulfosarcina sp.]
MRMQKWIGKRVIIDAVAAGILVMLTLWSLPVSGDAAEAVATLIVADQVEIEQPDVRLGDLARISGSDPARVAALRAIEIGRAPLAGQSR